MLDDFHEKCLFNLATEADKAIYNRVKTRLRNLMPFDKSRAYRTLQQLAEEVSFPDLMIALAELAILDGRVKFGSAVIDCLDAVQSPDNLHAPEHPGRPGQPPVPSSN